MRGGVDIPYAMLRPSARGEKVPEEQWVSAEDQGGRPQEDAPRPSLVLGDFARRKTPKVSVRSGLFSFNGEECVCACVCVSVCLRVFFHFDTNRRKWEALCVC